jgi:hypothetical protein
MPEVVEVYLPFYTKCPTCDPSNKIVSRIALVELEAVLDEQTELVGIMAPPRYPVCGHRIPWVRFDPLAIAQALEDGDTVVYGFPDDEDGG